MSHIWRSLLVLTSVIFISACSKEPATIESSAQIDTTAVTALGRLEPGLGIIEVGAPPGDRLLAVEVREGEAVIPGQVLAVLESRGVRSAEHALAEAAHGEAIEALRRAQQVGPLAVAAREAEVQRLEADLKLAASDFERTRALVDEAVLPARELDFHSSLTEQARARLQQGRSQLEQERRALRLEIRQAKASLAHAMAAVDAAAARLERTEIRSPIEGRVLDLRQFAGEPTDGGSILTLGEISEMVAVAEVYETDAQFIEVGQAAQITSPALPAALRGTVEKMGTLVRRNDVLSLDPAARSDVRVIEARIRLEDPESAARFVHLQVDIRIDTRGGS